MIHLMAFIAFLAADSGAAYGLAKQRHCAREEVFERGRLFSCFYDVQRMDPLEQSGGAGEVAEAVQEICLKIGVHHAHKKTGVYFYEPQTNSFARLQMMALHHPKFLECRGAYWGPCSHQAVEFGAGKVTAFRYDTGAGYEAEAEARLEFHYGDPELPHGRGIFRQRVANAQGQVLRSVELPFHSCIPVE